MFKIETEYYRFDEMSAILRRKKLIGYFIWPGIFWPGAWTYGGWPGITNCPECGAMKMIGAPCQTCAPAGKVKCPAAENLGHDKWIRPCNLCRGSGWVDEA